MEAQEQRRTMNDEDRKRIADALTAKGAMHPCPRCGRGQFSVAGYGAPVITLELGGGPLLGTPNSVAVVCTNCGYIAFHSASALGIPLQ